MWRRLASWLRWRDEWTIVALGGFLFFIATNTQTGWLYVVVAFLAALLVLGFIMPRVTLRGLQAAREVGVAVFEGEAASVRLRVANPSRRARYLVTVVDVDPVGGTQRFLIGRLAPLATVSMQYEVRPARRGVLQFAPVVLETATPVGFFPHQRRLEAPAELLVYPRAPEAQRRRVPSQARASAASSQTYSRAGHSYDFLGIREYSFGDDTRHLHWPSTARAGHLMVREFQDLAAHSLCVVVDNAPSSAPPAAGDRPLDVACRLAAAVARQARSESCSLVLLAGGGPGEVRAVHNPRGDRALEWLARLEPGTANSWCEVIRAGLDQVPRRAHLFVMATAPAVEDDVLRALAERRIRLEVALVESDAATAEAYDGAERTLRAAGIAVRRVRLAS